jgi:hypothetical protein
LESEHQRSEKLVVSIANIAGSDALGSSQTL